MMRRAVAAALEAVRVTATDKDRVVPVIASRLKLPSDEAADLFEQSKASWTTDGRATPAALQFAFGLDQRDLNLSQQPKASDFYDYALLPS